jgi:hypothetical protein
LTLSSLRPITPSLRHFITSSLCHSITWSLRHFVTFHLCLWLLGAASAGAQVASWSRTYGGTNDDWANAVVPTPDGGYVVAGATCSFGTAGACDVWVLKLDGWGNVQWQKTYGGTSWDGAFAIAPTSDGGYVVAGATWSFGAGSADVWVLKLDGWGNVQWQKTYGGTDWDRVVAIAPTPDGGYVVAGRTWSFGAGYFDLWVLKLDGSGNVQWQKTYGGTDGDKALAIVPTSDGGYVVAGETESFGAGLSDAWVLKLDGSGNVQWQKTYGGTQGDRAFAIVPTSDGGYIVAGETESFGAGLSDAWVLKLDGSGNVQWQKTYGGTGDDATWAIAPTSDGGYVVAGWTESFSAGSSDVWVLKLEADGTVRGCPSGLVRDSTASVGSTSVSPGSSSAVGQTTSASAASSSAVVMDSTASPITVCTGFLPPAGLSIQDPNGNGVWDSGETVTVVPAWTNSGTTPVAATGTASNVVNPPDVAASLTDSTADYGTIPAGGTADCQTATGNCYGITGSRTAGVWGHRDVTFDETVNGTFLKTWTLHMGPSFADVAVTDFFYRHVETLLHRNVTGGCTASDYCPFQPVTRAQMAVFISRSKLGGEPPAAGSGPGGSWNCTDNAPNHFTDVQDSDFYCPHVHWMWANGITGGCTATTYCPSDPVTRAQMAVFISRAVLGGEPPAAGSGPGGSWNCTDRFRPPAALRPAPPG